MEENGWIDGWMVKRNKAGGPWVEIVLSSILIVPNSFS